MQASLRARIALLASVLLLVLSACTPQPSPTVRPTPGPDPDAQRAALLAEAGDYTGAAGLYRQLATRFPERQADYLLDAADVLAKSDDKLALDAVLAELTQLQLTPDQLTRTNHHRAERLLQQGRPLAALDLLPVIPPQDLELRRAHHDLAARASRLSGNMLQSATELLALESLQTSPEDRLATQREILHTLALLSDAALVRLKPSPPGALGGWMDLALTFKRTGQEPEQLKRGLEDWQARHAGHDALPELLEGMISKLESQYVRAAHVAVLLPESGPYAGAAAAIRDGILAAWYQMPAAQRPLLQFYDASDPTRAWPLLGEVIAAGAEAVIGPLDKDSVRQLARAGELQVPVLALNQVALDSRPPAQFFQFSLSPEDEARQVAEKAWLDGHRHPVILAPNNDWGDRVSAAFRQRWLTLGGEVAGQQPYNTTVSDFGQPIRSVLHLDQSQARQRQLERLFGEKLEFEPRRRADVDFVFMAARSKQARQIRPQLQFHHAADLPVYATSHAWDGSAEDRNEKLDLEGILLPDMPWMVDADADTPLARKRLAEIFPASDSAYGRLYAMGIDSLRLLPHLKRLQSAPYETLDGQTGSLHMDALNQLHRQLMWTQLTIRGNKALGFAPRLDQPGSEILLAPEPAPEAEPEAAPPAILSPAS